MSETERNRATALRWVELFNGADMVAFVRETYAEEPVVSTCLPSHRPTAAPVRDVETLIAMEERMLRSAPGRRLTDVRLHADGDVVVVEAVLVDGDRPSWTCPFVSVQVHRDGRIVEDRNYGDFSDWPGTRRPRARG
jgi:ketosteroid isomerase-like protein